jgi:hypothetical protein
MFYTEDHLIEQPAVQFIRNELGWEVVNCYDEWGGGVSNQGRDGKREGGNIERPTLNIEVKKKGRSGRILRAIGSIRICRWRRLRERWRRRVSALVDGFQYFLGFHRLVKLAILLKWHSFFA